MDEIRLLPTEPVLIEGFRSALDVVAREEKYLRLHEAPPLDRARDFVEQLLADGGVQVLAVTSERAVVGWCDIIRGSHPGHRHVGRLGMGVIPEQRGRGIGKRLAHEAIRRAWEAGIEKVELEVFSSNTRAKSLYDDIGFLEEGVRRRARYAGGEYDDCVLMALFRPSTLRA